jgi:hypothetical protein
VTDIRHRLAAPCGHLVEDAEPRCHLGHRFPEDCAGCVSYTPGLTEQERTRCEVWTRVMGYHRPISAYNAGKQAEHAERRYFRERERD